MKQLSNNLKSHPNSYHIIAVLESYKNLKYNLKKLNKLLVNDQNLPGWIYQNDKLSPLKLRQKLFDITNQIEYYDSQDPKETVIYPGIIGSSLDTIEQIHTINNCKIEFKEAIQNLKKLKIKNTDPVLTEEFDKIFSLSETDEKNKREINTKKTLKRNGLARLNLKQCYRTIKVLPIKPKSISWTWANTKAITKISKNEAILKLQQKGNDYGILQQIQKVECLKDSEKLAIVQNLAPNLRANVVYPENNDLNIPSRQMIKGHMPIFYPEAPNNELPYYKPPKSKEEISFRENKRADSKLDIEVFLPAIRAYRYHK